jgi:hypothetical protein
MVVKRTLIEGTCDGCEKPFSVIAGSKEALAMRQMNVRGENLIFHSDDCQNKWMAAPEKEPPKPTAVPAIPKKR